MRLIVFMDLKKSFKVSMKCLYTLSVGSEVKGFEV